MRDLVVDMSQFYNQYAKVQPYLVNKEAPPAQERLQSPEEREKLDGLYECNTMRLLFDFVPIILVEPRQVHWPCWTSAGLSFLGGFAGYGY